MAKGEVVQLSLAEGVTITEGVEMAPGSYHAEVEDDTNWNGSEDEVSYDVSDQVDDARDLVWTFSRVADTAAGDFQLNYEIRRTETHVTVTCAIPPAAGTYKLQGVG